MSRRVMAILSWKGTELLSPPITLHEFKWKKWVERQPLSVLNRMPQPVRSANPSVQQLLRNFCIIHQCFVCMQKNCRVIAKFELKKTCYNRWGLVCPVCVNDLLVRV